MPERGRYSGGKKIPKKSQGHHSQNKHSINHIPTDAPTHPPTHEPMDKPTNRSAHQPCTTVQQYVVKQYNTEKQKKTHPPKDHEPTMCVKKYSSTAVQQKRKQKSRDGDLNSRFACPESTALPLSQKKKVFVFGCWSIFFRNI